jgi:plasmid stabilization system protein ParE
MRRIEWTPPAQEDLAQIDAYWWLNNPARADEILDRIRASAEFLIGAPKAGPAIDESAARKWNVRGTAYILIYRLGDDRIEILRVHHQRENWAESE